MLPIREKPGIVRIWLLGPAASQRTTTMDLPGGILGERGPPSNCTWTTFDKHRS